MATRSMLPLLVVYGGSYLPPLIRTCLLPNGVSEESGRRNLRMPSDDEVFAVVTEHLGGNHVRLRCVDGKERLGRIPGRMKYRTWINEGDVVLAEPWSWQDEKANVEWRYTDDQADQLRREGHIE